MMDENQFWELIESSYYRSDDLDEFAVILTNKLKKLSSEEIIGFKLREEKLRFDSYNSDFWCAGYIINGGCSDDSFEYFRCWVIAHGKDIFYNALKNPDSLADIYNPEIDDYTFEDLMYVANEAFETKTGKDIDEYIDRNNFAYSEGKYPEIIFNWEEDDEASMQKICPRLMEVCEF
jgi:hypothetical protein